MAASDCNWVRKAANGSRRASAFTPAQPQRYSTSLTSVVIMVTVNWNQELGYGRFESLRIERGEFVLDPWPTSVRSVKFGATTPNRPAESIRQVRFETADCAAL
jgi:hypothetical protein